MNTPYEVADYIQSLVLNKKRLPFLKLSFLGFLGGIYIAMAATLATFLAGGLSPLSDNNPVMGKLLAGIFFPIGIVMIVLVGSELFTGNTAYFSLGLQQRILSLRSVLWNWCVVWVTNFLGALFFAYIIVYLGNLFSYEMVQAYAIKTAWAKVHLSWGEAFVRGIGANWLVCLGLWMGYSSKNMFGRLVGVWLPVMMFVILGMEHSVANMFYIPMGMILGADFSVTDMFFSNLIPVTLGNIVGGGVFLGVLYGYLYAKKEAVCIDK